MVKRTLFAAFLDELAKTAQGMGSSLPGTMPMSQPMSPLRNRMMGGPARMNPSMPNPIPQVANQTLGGMR